MSVEIVEAVRVNFPTPLGARHGECLIAIAQALGGGAGLLLKDYGTHVTLPNGVKVSQDIICYPNGRIFDCLADGEGEAIPSWTEAHGSPLDPARYYAVSSQPVPDPPTPPAPVPDPVTPVPVPGTPCQCGEVVELLTAMRLENAARHQDVLGQLHRLSTATARARKFSGSARFIGPIDGEVSGVPV